MLPLTENDDARFIALARQLLDAAIRGERPEEVYIIRIGQWFDVKWRNFSGKVLGALPVHKRPVTIPPFPPHRVLTESHFSAASGSEAFVPSAARPLHIAQPSAENLTRAISRVSPEV